MRHLLFLFLKEHDDRWMSMATKEKWSFSNVKLIFMSGGNVYQTPKSSNTSTKKNPRVQENLQIVRGLK
jgi:hypothetical protein